MYTSYQRGLITPHSWFTHTNTQFQQYLRGAHVALSRHLHPRFFLSQPQPQSLRLLPHPRQAQDRLLIRPFTSRSDNQHSQLTSNAPAAEWKGLRDNAVVDPDAESDFRVRLIKYQNFNDLFYLRQHGKKYFSSSFTMYILPTQHSLTRMLETPFQADNRSNADNIDNRAKSNVANDTNNNATSIKHSSSTIGLSGADKQESSSAEELHELNQHLDELMPGTVWRDFVPRLFKTKAVRNKFRNEDLQLAYEQEMYEAHEHHLRKMEKRSWFQQQYLTYLNEVRSYLPQYQLDERSIRIKVFAFKRSVGKLAVVRRRAERKVRSQFINLARKHAQPGWDFFITPNPPCLAMPPEVIELELATAMRDLGCVRADKPIPTLPLSKYSEHPNWRSYTSRTADDRDNDDKCKKMETGDIVHVNKNAYNNGDSDDKNRIKTGTRPLSHGVKRYAKTSQVLRALATYSREVSYERTKQRGEGQNNLPHRQRRRQLKYRQRRKERALYGRPKTSYHAAFMEDKDHNKRDFYALDGSTQELFFSVPLVSSKVNRREIAATWARAIYMSARRLNNLHVMCSDMEELYHLILSDRKLLYYMAPSEVEAKLHPNLAKQGHLHVRNKSRFNPVLLDVFRQLLREKEATLFLMITAEFRKIVQSEQ